MKCLKNIGFLFFGVALGFSAYAQEKKVKSAGFAQKRTPDSTGNFVIEDPETASEIFRLMKGAPHGGGGLSKTAIYEVTCSKQGGPRGASGGSAICEFIQQ